VTTVVVLMLLGVGVAWADHGGAGLRDPGGGIGLGWLFLAGLVIVLGLAAWALFAPAPDDEQVPPEDTGPRRR
jgi:hypothetical protein